MKIKTIYKIYYYAGIIITITSIFDTWYKTRIGIGNFTLLFGTIFTIFGWYGIQIEQIKKTIKEEKTR